MRLFRHFTSLPADVRGAVVALGNFDGVHRGHQAVIDRAGLIARQMGRPLAVVSFEPHPRSVFRPDDPPFRLTPLRIKLRRFEALSVSLAFILHFDRDFAARSAENFVSEVLHHGLGAAHVVIGYDFAFSKGRAGDPAMLRHFAGALGFEVTVVDAVTDADGAVYSATRIREFLQNGDPQAAAAILGWLWEIDGRVEHGAALGRTIGFPTANVDLGDYLRPAAGVYAVRIGIERGETTEWHAGVANIGRRPTVNGTDLRLEAHLFDFSGDLYGQHLRVALVDYIRPEQKFAGLDALKAQIALDVTRARHVLNEGFQGPMALGGYGQSP